MVAYDLGYTIIMIGGICGTVWLTMKADEFFKFHYAGRRQPRWKPLVLWLIFLGALLLSFELTYRLSYLPGVHRW